MVIWVIGMSGAGKTTIATRLADHFRKWHPVVLLDGDILREVWGDRLGHDVEGRRANARRISQLCRMLDSQEIHVVAAVLSIFPEWQQWNRENFNKYFEVFVDVPMEILKARDKKDLYRRALSGEIENVVGVDIPFPRPPHPDLVIDNSSDLADPGVLADLILDTLPPI